jgi:hypothetical protein
MINTRMNGQLVIVKDVTGAPKLRRVCHATPKTVFVTSEKVFEAINNGTTDLTPIGFPAEDVYHYTGVMFAGSVNWAELVPWSKRLDDMP